MRLSTTFITIGLLALIGTAYASPVDFDNEEAGGVDALQESPADSDNAPLERRKIGGLAIPLFHSFRQQDSDYYKGYQRTDTESDKSLLINHTENDESLKQLHRRKIGGLDIPLFHAFRQQDDPFGSDYHRVETESDKSLLINHFENDEEGRNRVYHHKGYRHHAPSHGYGGHHGGHYDGHHKHHRRDFFGMYTPLFTKFRSKYDTHDKAAYRDKTDVSNKILWANWQHTAASKNKYDTHDKAAYRDKTDVSNKILWANWQHTAASKKYPHHHKGHGHGHGYGKGYGSEY
ncbi:hypothetical protein H4R34_001125 [Dimargaris verticillata]|uniref:Uncharacterized protein n=1 Tax=Dimargaris verticillata TaxID=2761393 RepID=A0A9W8EES5_9FUNG|nr:hypothetical protein H4R34_001125 [Dimargaris verticillata]